MFFVFFVSVYAHMQFFVSLFSDYYEHRCVKFDFMELNMTRRISFILASPLFSVATLKALPPFS